MHPLFKRRLRPIAVVILVFFSWFCIEPWNFAVAAPPAKPAKAFSKEKGSSEKLEESLHKIKSLTQTLDQDLAADQEIQPQIDQLTEQQKNIAVLDAAVQEEFAETEALLKAKNLPAEILDRHAKAVAEYQENIQVLRKNLDDTVRIHGERKRAKGRGDLKGADQKKGELRAKLKAAKSHLEEKVKERPHQKLDPNNLPHRTPKVKERKPRLKKEEFTEFQKPIQLAFNGDPSTLMLVQSTQDLPTPADLAETIEVQFTREIQGLASQLEHNPVKIYNWVHNNIDYVPTYGSIQGAQMCLMTKQCNDMDTASLLIALLRVSGIAARYVFGTIDVPIEQAMNWVGGFTDARAATQYIADGGTPVIAVNIGGKIARLRMEHTWVEAFVDYIPSRGAIHKQGDTWVPIDASFKSTTMVSGLDIAAITGFDAQTFLNDVLSTATIDQVTGSITNIDPAFINQQTNTIQQNLLTYITNENITGTLDTLAGSRTISPESPKILAGQLPFRVIARAASVSQVPPSLRHQLTFEILDQLQIPTSTYSAFLPELASKRITLSYIGATASDQAILDSAAESGATSLSVYLISVQPVLKVEGNTVSTGFPITMGNSQTIQVTLQSPSQIEVLLFDLIAGDYSAFGLNLAKASLELLEKRAARLSENYFNAVEQDLGINFDPPVSTDEIVGEGLHQNLLAWWVERDFYTQTLALPQGIIEADAPSLGLSASPLSITRLFGVPFKGTYRGFILDIKRDVTLLGHKSGDQTAMKAHNEVSGIIGSSLESEIFNQLYTLNSPPVSTAALLMESNRAGVPIYEITQSNMSQVLPLLQQSADFKTDVQNAVAAGKSVITSGRDVALGAYTGTGYIVLDPATGEGAYLISGGLAGGSTEEDPSAIPVAQIPPQAGALGFVIQKAASSTGTAVELTSSGEVLVKTLPAGGAGGAGGAGAAGIGAATVAAIIAVTVIISIFLTATKAGEGSEVTFFTDALKRTIRLDENHYRDHIQPHADREGFTRFVFESCITETQNERVEIWFRPRNGSTAIICSLAPALMGKVLFIVIDKGFNVTTSFIPERNPFDHSQTLLTSWPYILFEVTNPQEFIFHLFGDITMDPTKPYTIVGAFAVPRQLP